MISRVRVETGIEGLDKLIEGGFVPGSCVMVTGETGSGKTIFGCQFLKKGLDNKEPVLFITLEETPEEINGDVGRFGWDFLGSVLANIEYIDPSEVDYIENILFKKITENRAQRVVIDSLTLVGSYLSDRSKVRRKFHDMIQILKKAGCTSILVSEIPEGAGSLSKFGVEEFIVDGVIELRIGTEVVGGTPRGLIIRKMRRTKHDLNIHPMEIGSYGIRIR